MAALTGAITNGVYNKTEASTEATAGIGNVTTSKGNAAKGTEYNQEMFLQLLVAEMQYQDPLEPTSNTEYVSELASFSQIEAVQSVQEQMQTIEANSLVGRYVILLDDNEYISGRVDYVENDEGTLKIAVNNSLYTMDKIDSVVDERYYNAVLTAEAFTDAMKMLPTEAGVTLSDEKAISAARTMYDAMDSYTRGFIGSDTMATLTKLEKRIAALKEANEVKDAETSDSEDTSEENSKVEQIAETV